MVLVGDECRIEVESGIKKIWYEKGRYPEIRTEMEKKAVSFYGALNVKEGRCHALKFAKQNTDATIKYLAWLEDLYAGKEVLLIWDGAPWHRSKGVKEHLARKDRSCWLELMNFPPYWPELNPQERVWKEGRRHVSHNHEGHLEQKAREFHRFLNTHKFATNFLAKYA